MDKAQLVSPPPGLCSIRWSSGRRWTRSSSPSSFSSLIRSYGAEGHAHSCLFLVGGAYLASVPPAGLLCDWCVNAVGTGALTLPFPSLHQWQLRLHTFNLLFSLCSLFSLHAFRLVLAVREVVHNKPLITPAWLACVCVCVTGHPSATRGPVLSPRGPGLAGISMSRPPQRLAWVREPRNIGRVLPQVPVVWA